MPSRPPPTRPPVLPGEIPAWLRVPGAGGKDEPAPRRDAPPPNRMVIPPVRTVPSSALLPRPRPIAQPMARAASRAAPANPPIVPPPALVVPQAAIHDPATPGTDAPTPNRRRRKRRRGPGGARPDAAPGTATVPPSNPAEETLARGIDPAGLPDDTDAPPARRRKRRRNRKRRQEVVADDTSPRPPSLPRALPRPAPRPPEALRETLSPEDLAFRLLMHGVRPHVPAGRVVPPPRAHGRPEPIPHMRRADDEAVIKELLADMDTADALGLDNGETVSWQHPSLPEPTFRQLKRGGFRLEAELDLHGHNRDTARLAVAEFLARARERGWTTVRIIHGRGNGSPNTGPVLKRLLDGWLRRRADVLAFCTARPMDGGDGASYVLLRRARL